MTRVVLTMILFSTACGSDAKSGAAVDAMVIPCETKEVQGCTCDNGGLGIQICDDAGMFGACTRCAPPDPDPTKVNFQAQIVPIFEKSCAAGENACHSRVQFTATKNMDCRGWLSLENEAIGSKVYGGLQRGQPTGCPDMPLYERLTTLAPWECDPPSYYIKANDAANSYLMTKINGGPFCSPPGSMSVQMPPATSLYKLSAADKASIEQWIAEGALNN